MFLMGVITFNRINDYWNMDEMFNFTYISSQMSRDRFLNICQTFHLAENPKVGDHKPLEPVYKIRPILDHFHQWTEFGLPRQTIVYRWVNVSLERYN